MVTNFLSAYQQILLQRPASFSQPDYLLAVAVYRPALILLRIAYPAAVSKGISFFYNKFLLN
ncbi:hypothetical protein ACLHDD_08350 [Pantoea sp. NSTU24]|uniref:hypothetical protein n=1 Tax=Pantoea sp. NSTU24 TaxID=3391144 RepID=UPI003D04E403